MATHFEAQTPRGETVHITIMDNIIVARIPDDEIGERWESIVAHGNGNLERMSRHPSVAVEWEETPQIDAAGEEYDLPQERVVIEHRKSGLSYIWELDSDMFSNWHIGPPTLVSIP